MRTTRALILAALAALGAACSANGPEVSQVEHEKPSTGTAVATIGGGCFWCVEAVFERVEGVISVESGYAGGETENPTYEAVCSGTTGHAEVVQIRFDPAKIDYEDLLRIFFGTHDPTTPNRQGNDVGTQYRSIVLYHDEGQKEAAEKVIAELEEAGAYLAPIVTEVVPFTVYFPAEASHQDYYARNPNQGYCQVVVRPKVEKLERAFAEKLKK
jgi:peptide-methionine (S)-S-oxide reductase